MWLNLVEVNKEQETIKVISCYHVNGNNPADTYNKAETGLKQAKESYSDRDYRLIKKEDRKTLFAEVFDNKTKKTWKIYTEEFDDPYYPPYHKDIGVVYATHYEVEMYCDKWNEKIHKSEEYGGRDMALKCSEYIPLKEITLDTPPLEDIKEPEEFYSEEDLF